MADLKRSGSPQDLPPWAEEMRSLFRTGASSQFVLHGSVFDLVDAGEEDPRRFISLRSFLTKVMFAPFDVIVHYDRGRGIRVRKGGDHFHRFLKAFDSFQGTSWASLPESSSGMEALDLANLLPRDPVRALEIINRFLRASQHVSGLDKDGKRISTPLKVAIIIDYAHFIAPRGEAIRLSADVTRNLIQILDWASDPAITGAFVASVLITENLSDLNRMLVETPYNSKLKIELPGNEELYEFVVHATEDISDIEEVSEVNRKELAAKLVGLSRVNVRSLLMRALKGSKKITMDFLTEVKKELIEKEAFGRISFIESERTLDDVAGHQEAKKWLRQDAALLKRGRKKAIPMGYLLCGRIGTGKTFLVECWSGEVGIPVVAIKNFREKWVGATEGNLEKIFTILHALGQVIVFVDEADQMTGKRDGGGSDSGLSGRVYGMLAAEMSNTANRGKIIWIFATSRPDLLEVDLKRQGRLDVHIPLFPPGDPESRHELFSAMTHKVGLKISKEELPNLPDDANIGGNEMEGILVRASRLYETREEEDARPLSEIIAEVIADFRPSAHVARLEAMDLLAVKECTDSRFLPERFEKLSLGEVNTRLDELKYLMR